MHGFPYLFYTCTIKLLFSIWLKQQSRVEDIRTSHLSLKSLLDLQFAAAIAHAHLSTAKVTIRKLPPARTLVTLGTYSGRWEKLKSNRGANRVWLLFIRRRGEKLPPDLRCKSN